MTDHASIGGRQFVNPVIEYPIPGSFLRGSVSKDYVTVSAPSTKVVMRTVDAYFLMHWLYDMLPTSVTTSPQPRGLTDRQKDDDRRLASYSELWIRRRMAA